MSWHVYMVECSDGTLYAGVTNDLDARIAAHNNGTGAKYTRSRRPVKLVWKKRCRNKSAAFTLEYEIKRMTRAGKRSLIERA